MKREFVINGRKIVISRDLSTVCLKLEDKLEPKTVSFSIGQRAGVQYYRAVRLAEQGKSFRLIARYLAEHI
mgnify:CR=1 FL=1